MYKLALHIAMAALLSGQAHAQWWPPRCTVEPLQPSAGDPVAIVLSGEWGDSCVPNDSYVNVAGNTIRFDAYLDYPPDIYCLIVITPWSLPETVSSLHAGAYTVEATLYDWPGIPIAGPTPVCNFTVGDTADFQYRCVIVAAPSVTDHLTNLPESITEIHVDETLHVEFWATDSGETNTGIVSAYADLDYPEDLVTCQPPLVVTDLFPLFQSGNCSGSIVDELGGSQLTCGVGTEPQWARVAYVEFTAAGTGLARFLLEPARAESSACGRGLVEPSDIEYGACDVRIVQPTIVTSAPPNCAIDARQPSNPDGSFPAGWQMIDIIFNGGAGGLTSADFEIEVPAGTAPMTPAVEHPASDTVTVDFSRVIPLGAWSCVTYLRDGTQLCLGNLPGDVNGDGTAAPSDILHVIDCLNAVRTCEMYQCDVDRSNMCGPPDILRVIDLLNGAGVYDPWLHRSIPSCPGQAGQTQPRIESYSNSGCLTEAGRSPGGDEYPWCGDDGVQLTTKGNLLRILHENATYNCCPDEIVVSMYVDGTVLQLTEEQILTTPCHCMCCHCVEATIVDLAPGTYSVEYCWQDWVAHAEKCHVQEIAIPQPSEAIGISMFGQAADKLAGWYERRASLCGG